ncbi:trypsin-like peptidase domain-containing protein [Paenibacillus chondroitinus]|uniref:Trypsin-like peptidase domain-containing protein n=1 Tax=Paenibacillus chondroitinus TaxID=59842 RepID=A0ABU6D7J4_9BACL|nr:trypsin-like peptidase domain-containing protein [Paenibacillus chondroitinus]MCY9661624.1 trypsin-like peptidase domain-containing protein [Paenibacillus anseongense]MEB4793709.1 trypsin-like peptidase domain-containing protein [Paenibacillus chondroitinus]
MHTRYVISTLLALMLLGGNGQVFAAQATSVSHWQTKELDGEVYVKASDVVKTLGGSGDYRAEANDFSYTSASRITEVVKKVSPSIVGIIGKPMSGSQASSDNRFNLAHGTGIIVQSDGLIVTNAHVVEDMKQIIVVTSDGKQYAGKTIHLDEESDLAVVQIDAKDLPAATFAKSSNVEVGELVVAIGTPITFALRNSVTYGVISGTDRSLHSTYRLLQTDAAINPGNSGGALVNLQGEVIGINSLKLSAAGIDGLGFAIPSDTVQYILNQFIKYGKVKRPALGLEVEESWAAVVGLPTDEPLKVSRVDPHTSAADAGIKEGDVLYSVNNSNVKTLVDLNELLKQYLPGDKVTLTLQSNGDIIQKDIILLDATQTQ